MKDIIRKFTLSAGLFVDCSAGTLPVTKACILLLQHRRFFGCDLDSECIASSLPQMALFCSRQLLNKESDITGDDNVQQAAFTFFNVMEELELKHCIDVWEMPAGFPIMQILSLHILHNPSTYHLGFSLHDQAKNIPANLWTPWWRSRLDIFVVRSLLAVGCNTFDVKMKDSNIHHDSNGCGMFSGDRSVPER